MKQPRRLFFVLFSALLWVNISAAAKDLSFFDSRLNKTLNSRKSSKNQSSGSRRFLSSNDKRKSLEYAKSIQKKYHIPELSYAVVTGKAILEIAAIGQHSAELKEAATLNDRFHIGSNTKAMTAFVIAKYIEKGKLSWKTKFFDIFPEWKESSNPQYFDITLQDLLSHRAKIQPFQGEGGETVPQFKGNKQEKRTAFGRYVLTLEPAKFEPNTKFVYSNAGYTLAALMLEKVIGKSWEQLINEVFNHDLKINAKFSFPENQKKKDTWGHLTEGAKLTAVPSNKAESLDYTEPAGDLNLKLKDYIKFIQLNIKGLEGRNNYLQAETYNFIHKGVEDYSIGWYNSNENGQGFSTHAGTAGTYYTIAAIDRKKFIGYIIFTNSFNEETVNGVKLLMRKLKENY